MNRTEFISTCSMGCLALATIGPIAGCTPYITLQKSISNNQIRLVPEVFLQGDAVSYHRFVVLNVDKLDYQIVVYRYGDTDYQSILLKCTHQGTPLNVYGDLISCPAHGSEFTKDGAVLEGPATESLKTFETKLVGDEILIKLV